MTPDGKFIVKIPLGLRGLKDVRKHFGGTWWNSCWKKWWATHHWAAGSVPPWATDWQTDWSATRMVKTECIPPIPSCTTCKKIPLSTVLLCSQRENIQWDWDYLWKEEEQAHRGTCREVVFPALKPAALKLGVLA